MYDCLQNGIRWPDIRSSGVSLRSQRTKLPLSVGLKKTKAIECMLKELAIDLHPPPTGKIHASLEDGVLGSVRWLFRVFTDLVS
jgi:hypothetical protein